MVARLFDFHRLLNEPDEIVIGATTRQHAVEIVVEVREEASSNFAVGCEADAAAGATKGLRHGRDNANFTDAIVEGIAARGLCRGC